MRMTALSSAGLRLSKMATRRIALTQRHVNNSHYWNAWTNHRSLSSSTQLNTTSSSDGGVLLHSEWISTTASTKQPGADGTIVFLHGLLGNGRNIKSMAKKMCDFLQKPGLLIDIRGHGRSVGRNSANETTTFAHCIKDISTTLNHNGLGENNTTDQQQHLTLVGHSLGGRLALQYAFESQEPACHHVWLLDTVPGHPDASVVHVVGVAESLLLEQDLARATRKDITTMLTQTHGLDLMTAQWLASSFVVDKDTGRPQFGFDLKVARDLIADFGNQDFLGLLNDVVGRQGMRVDLVRGGRNKSWESSGHLPGLNALQKNDSFQLHTLDKAGHWVHIDDLPGLLQAVETSNQR